MNILSIGNSFSQDAQRYLHNVAKNEGEDFHTINLYIGGCPFSTHYANLGTNDDEYSFELNGESSGLFISIRKALKLCNWDVITIQQASHFSFKYDTYQPYADELVKVIRKECPQAKLYVHETWGYENGSEKLESTPFKTMEEMSLEVFKCYERLAAEVKADGIIRDGKAMLELSSVLRAHRDGFHVNLGYGRYMLACVWYKTLTGKNVVKDFTLFDENVTPEQQKKARKIANEVC